MKLCQKTITCALLGLSSAQLSAAGFQLSEHSANGLGRAFAGEGAIAENAAVIARNPAAITRFKSAQLSFGSSYINPEVDIKGHTENHYGQLYNSAASAVNSAVPGADLSLVETRFDASQNDIAPEAVIPSLYYLRPINQQWSWGLGLFSNFGLSTDYDRSSHTSEFADKAEITTVNINPVLAYRLNDQWSLGGGINLVYADAKFSTTTPAYMNGYVTPINEYNQIAASIGAPSLRPVPGNATLLHLTGDDWQLGWNVGALWQPSRTTRLALSYRSEVKLRLDGHTKSDLSDALNDNGTVDLNLPAISELSLHHEFTPHWSVQASAMFTEWSSFKRLEADLDHLEQKVHIKEEQWNNSWRLAAGATYRASQSWTLRAGYAYDETPVDAEYRTLSIPDSDRQWFTLGSSIQWDEHISVDLAYAYLNGRKVSVKEEFSLTTTSPDNGETINIPVSSYEGHLDSADAHIFSAQFNYSF